MSKKNVFALVLMIMEQCASTSGASTGFAASSKTPSPPDHYVVFFEPKVSQLDADGQAIVRKAAIAIEERRPTKIEIIVPAKLSGGRDVVEARYAAIIKIISDSDVDASRVILAADGIDLEGAGDRAEIRLIP